MKEKKYSSAKVLKDLIKYITLSLVELTEIKTDCQFCEGEIIAFVECLEFVSKWTGYHKFGIANIEQRFPVK